MKHLYLSIFILLCSAIITAQTKDEVLDLRIERPITSQSIYIDSAKVHNSEYELVAHSLFRLYKKYISSNDNGGCVFTPSCSEYALLAIKKQGITKGYLNTVDRLLRCNRHAIEYSIDSTQNGLIHDPARNIFYEEK